jgi:hypothetical protein
MTWLYLQNLPHTAGARLDGSTPKMRGTVPSPRAGPRFQAPSTAREAPFFPPPHPLTPDAPAVQTTSANTSERHRKSDAWRVNTVLTVKAANTAKPVPVLGEMPLTAPVEVQTHSKPNARPSLIDKAVFCQWLKAARIENRNLSPTDTLQGFSLYQRARIG